MIRFLKLSARSLEHSKRTTNPSLIYYLVSQRFEGIAAPSYEVQTPLNSISQKSPKLSKSRSSAPALFIGRMRTRPAP